MMALAGRVCLNLGNVSGFVERSVVF